MSWAPPDDARVAPSRDLRLAIAQIEAVRVATPSLAETARQMIDLADRHEDLAWRTARPGHLTGSAMVIDSSGEHVALLFHTKLRRWLQPGGHADGETNLAAVALREATEETGIEGLVIDPNAVDLDIHRVAPPAEDPHLHLDVRFVVAAPEGAVLQRNHESTELRWVRRDELRGYDVDAGLVRLADAALERFSSLRRPRR